VWISGHKSVVPATGLGGPSQLGWGAEYGVAGSRRSMLWEGRLYAGSGAGVAGACGSADWETGSRATACCIVSFRQR